MHRDVVESLNNLNVRGKILHKFLQIHFSNTPQVTLQEHLKGTPHALID